jgi:hypothetical protein
MITPLTIMTATLDICLLKKHPYTFNMTEDIAQLHRQLSANKAHISALSERLKKETARCIMLEARIEIVSDSAKKRLKEASDLIDTLERRIEAMCDEWECQVINHCKENEKETKRSLDIIAPFRLIRIGQTEVKTGAP